ncbi:MAG: hypothetical protein K6F64_04070 [Clostridia bacterium]|nr:hypothetical protein [Clostridia bacterium]
MKTTVRMPDWGPYSKKYMGISHIPASLGNTGARFDFIVHPTLWNSSTPVPNVTFPSGYHLRECSENFDYYSYRYDLSGSNNVYADISFSRINDGSFLMRCEFVNNSFMSQNCILNAFASMEFPFEKKVEIIKPSKCNITDASDYVCFDYAVKRPWDGETPDGMKRGTFRDENFSGSIGLGDRCNNDHVHFLGLKPFGCVKGDRVDYNLSSDGILNPVTVIRYRTVTQGDAVFSLNGESITLPHSECLAFARLPFSTVTSLVSEGGAGVEFDFIAVIEENETVDVEFKKYPFIPEHSFDKGETSSKVRLDYKECGCSYTVYTFSRDTRLRTLDSGCLEDALINRLSNADPTYDNLRETFSASFHRKKSDEGFFVNPLIKSIFIEPHGNRIEYMVVSKDDIACPEADALEDIYLRAKALGIPPQLNKDGEKYAFSVNTMRATLMTNTVYPVYRRGENIVHHTPGKRWDSFYTWDSGFIGLGLLEYSPELCRYVLETYLCDESNRDFVFLLHGSLVPTQFAEYFELLKRTPDKSSLAYLYPMMKRYYEFLRGRLAGSTFNKFGNGLLTAYDYWYSCSGMDDYPAQVAMIENKVEEYSCPCLTTSQVIIAGKIMRAAALSLGKTDDVSIYDEDISLSAAALNKYAWDEESGYYGYTLYDKDRNNPYLMKTRDGENADKGFDGVYPFIAGVAPKGRKERIISHIKSPCEMWSDAGISAVDMSASYYFDDGYWNGNVWMSHQWFVWKAMLDNGDTDFAFEIANRALNVWKNETDNSGYTFECFGIKTLRGGWFHNFGGLSAPVCIWADAYYRPGTITSGFDVWTDRQFCDGSSAEIRFKYSGANEKYAFIVVMNEDEKFTVTLDGKEIRFNHRTSGALEIVLDGEIRSGTIRVEKTAG